MKLDDLKFQLGGDWYDTWWCGAFSWHCLWSESSTEGWLFREWHKGFFEDINSGWLEMNKVPEPTWEDLIAQMYCDHGWTV